MMARRGPEWVDLTCPKCDRLLARGKPPAVGSTDVETVCRRCGTKVAYTLTDGHKPLYKVLESRLH